MWDAILTLHLLAMAFFVGGQLLLAAAVVPVERENPDRERLRAIARRFGAGSVAALVVLLATGIAMASHFDLWGSNTLQIKLGLVAVVFFLVLIHLQYPQAHALQAAIFLLSLGIVWAGVVLAD